MKTFHFSLFVSYWSHSNDGVTNFCFVLQNFSVCFSYLFLMARRQRTSLQQVLDWHNPCLIKSITFNICHSASEWIFSCWTVSQHFSIVEPCFRAYSSLKYLLSLLKVHFFTNCWLFSESFTIYLLGSYWTHDTAHVLFSLLLMQGMQKINHRKSMQLLPQQSTLFLQL